MSHKQARRMTCRHCGYIYHGPHPPATCPNDGATLTETQWPPASPVAPAPEWVHGIHGEIEPALAPVATGDGLADLRLRLMALSEKWDSADYAIAQVNNPLLPQEQCAIELRKELQR